MDQAMKDHSAWNFSDQETNGALNEILPPPFLSRINVDVYGMTDKG